MTDHLDRTIDLARELLELEDRSPPQPPEAPETLAGRIEVEPPRRGLSEEELWRRLRQVVTSTPRTSSRRFFNALFAGREPAAAAGELLASLLNISMYTYKMGGPHILIEHAVTRRMAELGGYPDGEGLSVPGGSIGNLVAMIVARGEACPQLREQGHDGRRHRVYVSEEGHYSVRKNAGLLGLGRSNVREIEVDSEGRMRADWLDAALERDRAAGELPVCVVATAGTTVRGVFDPLAAIAEVTERHGVWLHVDGALGASLLLHPEYRRHLDGLERSDSFCWDAHKMMGVPLSSAFVLMRRRGLLQRHFDESADYLFQQDDAELNPGTRSIQCGRRNDVLKLWAAWLALGDEGWARRLECQRELALHACDQVRRRGFVLSHEPECLNVCFEVPGCSSAEICDRLHRSGEALVGHGSFAGRQVVRLVTANPTLETADLDRFFDAVERFAAEIRSDDRSGLRPAGR